LWPVVVVLDRIGDDFPPQPAADTASINTTPITTARTPQTYSPTERQSITSMSCAPIGWRHSEHTSSGLVGLPQALWRMRIAGRSGSP
ncbi:MAG: hypothetical protein JWN10_2036, partial [Solirubrobacterales bacterium]|nr:hypothetical protein [Solirubrobacterales bacterium]